MQCTAMSVDESEVVARWGDESEVRCAFRNRGRVRGARTRGAAMAGGTGKGGDAIRRQQVARGPVAQAGLGGADGSLVTLVVDRHDTALACNRALRRDRPVPEDRLLAMLRITLIDTQLRHRASYTARENGSPRLLYLLLSLMSAW